MKFKRKNPEHLWDGNMKKIPEIVLRPLSKKEVRRIIEGIVPSVSTKPDSTTTLRLPTQRDYGVPLWDFDFRCTQDQSTCWIAVPLTMGRIALYRLPYADPPAGLRPPDS